MLELVELAHGVALGRRRRHVVVVDAVVALALDIEPRRQQVAKPPQRHGAGDGGPRPVCQPAQVDVREGLRVPEIPGQPEHRHGGLRAVRDRAAQGDAHLPLGHVLAGVPPQVDGRRGIPVRPQLGEGERAWIVGPGIIPHVRQGRERPAAHGRLKPRVQVAQVRGAVVAHAVVPQARHVHEAAARAHPEPCRRLPLGPRAAGIVAGTPGDDAQRFVPAAGGRGIGPDAHDAAGGVAEERRGGAAEDLDAVHRTQVEVGELALAVGQGLRDAVHQDLDPAHGERGAAPEAADREPLIERKVVAIGDEDARHAGQRLVEAPGGLGVADLRFVHQLNGARSLGERERAASCGNGDGGEDDPRRHRVGFLGVGHAREPRPPRRHRDRHPPHEGPREPRAHGFGSNPTRKRSQGEFSAGP